MLETIEQIQALVQNHPLDLRLILRDLIPDTFPLRWRRVLFPQVRTWQEGVLGAASRLSDEMGLREVERFIFTFQFLHRTLQNSETERLPDVNLLVTTEDSSTATNKPCTLDVHELKMWFDGIQLVGNSLGTSFFAPETTSTEIERLMGRHRQYIEGLRVDRVQFVNYRVDNESSAEILIREV